MKTPPVKKPRQDCLSAQAKKEEKKKAEQEHADTLAYISQAICSAGPELVTMRDKRMFLPGGITRMDQIVAPAKECFVMFVFMSLRAT
jgi:hypothetical protein